MLYIMNNEINSLDVFQELTNLVDEKWVRQKGCLGPPQVVLGLMFMTVLGTKGYERTIDELKIRLGEKMGWDRESDVPSASALCQARRKFSAEHCSNLFSQVYAYCSTARTCPRIGYGGMRVLAIDGTKLPLPAYAVFRNHFGCPSQGDGKTLSCPQASLTMLWDTCANQVVDWNLGTYKTSEQVQARALISSVGVGDLILGDRLFPSRRLLTTLHRQKADFLMRIRTDENGTMREVTKFLASGLDDALVSIETRDENDKQCSDLATITVRLFKKTLEDGNIAVFVTSLKDTQKHGRETLAKLYTQRWGIETAFKEMKLWHGLERFHARHVEGIAQEIAAIMIFLLLASELEAQVRLKHQESQPALVSEETQETTLQEPEIRFNRRIVADCTVNLIIAAADGRDLKKELNYAFFRIWRYKQKPRPGRSFPRERKSAPRGWKQRGTKGKGGA
jgi:hypothetical protein